MKLSSLGDLLRERGVPVADEVAAPVVADGVAAPAQFSLEWLVGAKVVLRRQRKGYGGKTVTVIEGLAPGGDQLDALARQLRKALGSGARVEGTRVIVQGDLGDATEAWLRSRGVARVTRGN